ncbi:unnamed protein product [Phytomonas sp. EM1]|nr:unnamed protein product [Phytomonas sp. EM1]|eukprot:CCW61932.1 unnamed protein product [Phytomonas sp. isolate EM1]
MHRPNNKHSAPMKRGGSSQGRKGENRTEKAKSARRPASVVHIKKNKTKYHENKFKQQRKTGEGFKAKPDNHSQTPHKRSFRTNDVDIHLASRISKSLKDDIAHFKAKNAAVDEFGDDLNAVFKFVPPTFITQHMSPEVSSFRTYLPKFMRGAPNNVVAFLRWYEWSNYELTKGKHFPSTASSAARVHGRGTQEDGEAETATDETPGQNFDPKGKLSATKQAMTKTLKEREHMRALLQMCLRHNAARRKEGQHAFIKHLRMKLLEDAVSCNTLDELRATANHSVLYALSRLLLGMVSEDMAKIVLHCHALYLVLTQTPITPPVVLSLMDEEFAMVDRMKAVQLHLTAAKNRNSASGANDGDDDHDLEIDPDAINDPTKGERNQRLTAAVFVLAAIVAAGAGSMKTEYARRLVSFLAFCYVEQKGSRVLSGNSLFMYMDRNTRIYEDTEAMTWVAFAFFHYPRVEYLRPEGVQFLLRIMSMDPKPPLHCFPQTIEEFTAMDPLEPSVLEQLVSALFRKEQVTAVHPMVHPVWDDFFKQILLRISQGESMKEHFSTFVHTAIVPYRRGNADIPRRALFQVLVTQLGQLAVKNEDAAQRVELLHMASKNVGYGKRTTAKPTPVAELKTLTVAALDAKINDLLRQYRITKDSDPAARTNRTWVLRELRNSLNVPLRSGVRSEYPDKAAKAMLEMGFFPPRQSKDSASQNRCIYLFAEAFSFTSNRPLARPKCTMDGLSVISTYLTAEERGQCRYTTALQHSSFRKARNRIVEALEKPAERSVLFYNIRDIEVLMVFLFLILSVDDASNPAATGIATSLVPDLVQFYYKGTLETLDIFFDILMSLALRESSPLHVMPLMTCVRRISMRFMLKFAPFIRTKVTTDILVAALREAYHTDSRELARQQRQRNAEDADEQEDILSAEDSEDDTDNDNDAEENVSDSSSSSASSDASEATSKEDDADAKSASTELSDGDDDTEVEDDDGESCESIQEGSNRDSNEDEESSSTATEQSSDYDSSDDRSMSADEAPTQQFVDALKGMIGNADLDHLYATDTAKKDKSDVAWMLHLVSRVGSSMRSPLVVHIYQVLLAVCRETVKSPDDLIFNKAVSSLEALLLSQNRYFGHFLPAQDLFQLLGDIQSYCRKLESSLIRGSKEFATAKSASIVPRRMKVLKALALRVFHFLSFLAYKNYADEEVRITLSEYYKSIFCDRGWDMKQVLPGLKKDLYSYRHGFVWALLPAVFEKFDEVVALNAPQRARILTGCCTIIESLLSRITGLPGELKESASIAICKFIQSISLSQVYEMKYTLPYTYLHTIKMILKYNSRIHLDPSWVATNVVKKAVEDESLQFSSTSLRVLSSIEHLLGLTPRALETVTPTPVKVLYQQFSKTGADKKKARYSRNKRARIKVMKALLAFRNKDMTDEERALKRRRREERKVEARLERQLMRENRNVLLTKEEREERRKQFMIAKQERIKRNRERRMRIHKARQASFEKWREAKLAAAATRASMDHDSNEE